MSRFLINENSDSEMKKGLVFSVPVWQFVKQLSLLITLLCFQIYGTLIRTSGVNKYN